MTANKALVRFKVVLAYEGGIDRVAKRFIMAGKEAANLSRLQDKCLGFIYRDAQVNCVALNLLKGWRLTTDHVSLVLFSIPCWADFVPLILICVGPEFGLIEIDLKSGLTIQVHACGQFDSKTEITGPA